MKTDASDTALGAILKQVSNHQGKPVAFFSKKLSPAQKRYSTYDRELLAIYEAIKYFKDLIQSHEILVETEHKPLTYAFRQRPEKASPRQARQLDLIAQFITDIRHVPGEENTIVDTLSRIDAIETPVIVTTEELATEQSNDDELRILLRGNTSLQL